MISVEATAADRRMIEGAQLMVNGMSGVADDARFAAHLVGHEHLRASGVEGVVGHHGLALNVEIVQVGSGRLQTIGVC